jgi:hypothetical protein
MNIHELSTYNLADAVKFHDRLNPRLFGADEKLLPIVRNKLLEIAADFQEFLGVDDLQLQDVTVSGSNAAYSYTDHSDIDLHLVVKQPDNEVYRELFDAKKYQYNDQHNITIGGYDVELYVQDADQPHVSQGIYSVLNDDWIAVPRRRRAVDDDMSVQNKYQDIGHRVEQAIDSNDIERVTATIEKLKQIRKAGLEANGEFGPENLAYKMLRKQGYIQRLFDRRNQLRDAELSLNERKKKKPRKRYGVFGGYWYPGYAYAGQDHAAGSEGGGDGGGGESIREASTPDGVSPSTRMFLSETPGTKEILKKFIRYVAQRLEIEKLPRIRLHNSPAWSEGNTSFGRYDPEEHVLHVSLPNRHILDILRTTAHELAHCRQHEIEPLPFDAGETGSDWENEAHAVAGMIMRDFTDQHPEYFEKASVDESFKSKLAAGALATALAAGGAQAQGHTIGQALGGAVDAARTAQTLKRMGWQGAQADLNQEIVNYSRALGGDANAQNQSWLYRQQHGQKSQPSRAQPQSAEQAAADFEAYKKDYLRKKAEFDQQFQSPVKESSGYIPTKKQRNDARFKTALTVDIQPGQVGKEANKLKLHTDSQGQPGLLMKTANLRESQLQEKLAQELAKFKDNPYELRDPRNQRGPDNKFGMNGHVDEDLTEEQQLDEVKMSPSALQQWAQSPEAEGIRAGFEAELIFRDTTNDDDDDDEMEPDYDYDERARSVSQVIDFFNGGDFGGLSDRQESRLQEGLDEQYMEWQDERMRDAFDEEAEDLVRKVIEEEDWDLDNEIQKQLELANVSDDEFQAIIQAGEQAPRFTRSSDQQAYTKENPLYQKYLDAQTEAEDLLDTLVQDSVRSQDKHYDAALDDFRENFYVDDDSDFFSDVGLSYMSDIASEYSLDWPYLTGSGGGNNGGSREWDNVGDSLKDAIDMPVRVSQGYHSMPRKEGLWIVEPDSSLSPDDREDFGLEIVSPPMPLLTALEKLQEVTDWANNPSEGNAYTNSSTGLHMGVSVPYKGGDVDYLKLILFLGDEYVLQSFGREANTYTKSAMQKFRENIRGGRADPAGALMLMKNNLIEFAQREIQKGVGTGKYTSAHIQDGYIEFRSAGGDWLAEESADPQKLSSTMLRYARAMQIAADPSAERREFAKKLYKLVAPEGDSQLALFSQFAAGEIDKDQLKKQWAEKTIGTERKMNQRWKLYNRATGEPVAGQEYNGYTEDEARARAKGKISPGSSDRDFDASYELRNIGQDQQWEIYSVDTGETLEIVTGRNKGEAADAVFDKYANQGIGFNVRPYQDPATMTPRAKLAKRIASQPGKSVDYNYEIVNQADVRLPVVDKFYATNDTDAQKVYSQWLKSKNLPDDTADYGYRKVSVKPAETQPNVAQNFRLEQAVDATGELVWEIYDRRSGRAIEEILAADQADAESEAQAWLESTSEDPSLFGVRPKLEA